MTTNVQLNRMGCVSLNMSCFVHSMCKLSLQYTRNETQFYTVQNFMIKYIVVLLLIALRFVSEVWWYGWGEEAATDAVANTYHYTVLHSLCSFNDPLLLVVFCCLPPTSFADAQQIYTTQSYKIRTQCFSIVYI